MMTTCALMMIAQLAAGQAEAAAVPAEQPPAEAPTAPAAEPSSTGNSLRLERGLKLLDMGEYDAARSELELALEEGPYRYDQVVALYRGLGLVRAFLDDQDGARQAFEQLLAVAPGHTLPYTVSPKATFVFDAARQALSRRRNVEIKLSTEPVVAFDQPVAVRIARPADPTKVIARVVLLHRLKGQAEYIRQPIATPAVGEASVIELPAIAADKAEEDEEGTPGALLQLAALGYDSRGWEVFRGPEPERPLEVPVGFAPPGPWYTRWWFWGLVVGGATALSTAVVVAAVVAPAPELVPVRYEVLP